MIQVSIKPHQTPLGQVECFTVDNIFTDTVDNRVVLHFSKDENFRKLLNLSLKYGWEMYKYAEDNHVGIYVNECEIFWVKYL